MSPHGPPPTLAIFFAIGMGWGGFVALRAMRRCVKTPRESTLIVMWITLVWITALGTGLEVMENKRFRFLVEPLALILVADFVSSLLRPGGAELRRFEASFSEHDVPQVSADMI